MVASIENIGNLTNAVSAPHLPPNVSLFDEGMTGYPDMEFPRANDGVIDGEGCSSWDCVSFTSCYWMQYVANKTGAASMEEVRSTVISAIESVPEDSWSKFLLPPSVMKQLKTNITESECSLDVDSYPPLPFHDWKLGEDGPEAAPLNHKVLAETDAIRVVNVYGYPNEPELMHSHKWMSIFLQWGIDTSLCISQYDENYTVVHDSQPCPSATTEPRQLAGMFWLPQYLHSNFYYPQTANPRTANCPLEQSPHNCTGFFIRVEFKLGESLEGN